MKSLTRTLGIDGQANQRHVMTLKSPREPADTIPRDAPHRCVSPRLLALGRLFRRRGSRTAGHRHDDAVAGSPEHDPATAARHHDARSEHHYDYRPQDD
jgi:hypothetical protein